MTVKVILIMVVLLGAGRASQQGDLRVYKGKADEANEFPFALVLQMESRPFLRICTGSLIAENWVLTAGHCIPDKIQMIIRYDDFIERNSTKLSRVIKTFTHPDYQFNMGTLTVNDVALVLVQKIRRPYVQLLALDYKALLGLPVKYAGFGFVNKKRKGLTPIEILKDQIVPLQVGEGVVVPCETKVLFHYGPSVCIAPKCSNKLHQARPGDSGGPVVYDGKIVGVLSSVSSKTPLVYCFPTSTTLAWIKSVMQT